MSARRALRGRAFIDGVICEDALIILAGDLIDDVQKIAGSSSEAQRVEGIILPGLVDVHVHGAAGADFMDGDAEANAAILRFHARHGTTSLAATTLSAPRERLEAAVAAMAETAKEKPEDAAEIVAIHLEGPYISPKRAGAQHRASLRPADPGELELLRARAPSLRWIVTVAPEVEGVLALIDRFRKSVVFSIGHTSCTYAQALEAVDHGATHFTHLLNAMTPLHHRDPGVVGAAIVAGHTTAELIADGIHVHPIVLRMFVQLMHNRIALITDAMRACGMPEGRYKLYDHEVTVDDGAVHLKDGTLAGSVLTMIGAVRNLVELSGLPLEAVVPLASEVPARVLGLERSKGYLRTGYDADVLVVSPRFEVERLFLRGREVSLR